MKVKGIYSKSVFVLFLFLMSTIKAQDVVATYDSAGVVTFKEIQNYVYYRYFDKLYRPVVNGYYAALDQVLLKKIKVMDYFKRGFHLQKQYVVPFQRMLNEELFNEYYKKQYYEKYINDSTIRQAYMDVPKEVFAEKIIIRKNITDKKPNDTLLQYIYNIKSDIENGISFSAIQSKYGVSSQPFSVDWEMSTTDSFSDIVFSLSRGSVTILEDSASYAIVKVNQISRKKEVPPLESVKDKIIRSLEFKTSYKREIEFEQEQRQLIGAKELKWNQKALTQIIQWSETPNFFEGAYKDTIDRAIKRGKNIIIVQSPKLKVDLIKLRYYLEEVLALNRKSKLTDSDIKNYIVEASKVDAVAAKARKLKLEQKVFDPYTTNDIIIDEIVKVYDAEVIDKQIPVPTEKMLRDFYNEVKDTLYFQKAKVILYIALADDTSGINLFKKRIEEGTPYERVDNRVFVRSYIRERNGELVSEIGDEFKVLTTKAFSMNRGDVVGPVRLPEPVNEKSYALLMCVHRNEEKQLEYDEVGHRIIQDFRKHHQKLISAKVKEELLKKYNAVVDEAKFRTILQLLKILK